MILIALAICIVVVLILLMSCWNQRPRRRSCRRDGMAGKPDSYADLTDDASQSNYRSNSGTGVINRQLAAQYNDLQDVSSFNDWNEVSQYASLEPEIFKSQAEYAADINNSTSGASAMAVRSDSQDINPRVGLRSIDYNGAFADNTARQVPSENPDQMYSKTTYTL